MSFSCFLIGGKNLLIECGEILRAEGHQICGVITADPAVTEWARQHAIEVVPVQEDFREALAQQPFDYLFSMAYLSVIPKEILALPHKGAINFHDGPLPRYAGLNTPNWAIYHGEMEYGITWHYMAEGVDQGDILVQKTFDTTPGETALSLNTRCFEAGIESFANLVGQLEAGTETRLAQDPSQYRYFSKRQRPPSCGVLDWRQSAQKLECLVRSLHCGVYENPLGMAKLFHGGRLLEVRRAEVREGFARPGQVMAINEEILVGTGDGLLALLHFGDLEGNELPPSKVVSLLNISEGSQLDLLGSSQLSALTRLNDRLTPWEGFWIRRLSKLTALNLPVLQEQDRIQRGDRFKELPISIPLAFQINYSGDHVLHGVFAMYLALLSGKTTFHMGFSEPELLNLVGPFQSWVSPRSILQVKLSPYKNFKTNLTRFLTQWKKLRKRASFTTDLRGRYPRLRSVGSDLSEIFSVNMALETPEHPFQPADHDRLCLLVSKGGGTCRLLYNGNRVPETIAQCISSHLTVFMEQIVAGPNKPTACIHFLREEERDRIIRQWNPKPTPFPRDRGIHDVFETIAARHPHHIALAWENESWSYGTLNARANHLAQGLLQAGMKRGELVGVCLPVCLDLPAAVLAVMKAGGAWLPLDPSYPPDRIQYMIEDAGVAKMITTTELATEFSDLTVIPAGGQVTLLEENPRVPNAPLNLAYVIYTSGSTGKPKGVMVSHSNALNFFSAMDALTPHKPPGCWLAVTSLSFDISVFELLWTLTRGFKVVLYHPSEKETTGLEEHQRKPMAFGLFYFSADSSSEGRDKYKLLLEGAKFADAHGFNAVWTPERHFHVFGGLYPDPAVTGSAVAAITKNVRIRSGSLVLPLHHPVRVAEAWSVVDNISNGRVDLALAAGWQPNDFLLMPENYADAKGAMVRDMDILRKLWRGQSVSFPGPLNEDISITTLPRPIQQELPLWITVAGNPETYRIAGEQGANVLTHLLGQSVEELVPKLEIYREARKKAGHPPNDGVITLMLHTFVGENDAEVKPVVREPLKAYLRTTLHLLKKYAWSFPAFKKPEDVEGNSDDGFAHLTVDEQEAILDHAFERYYAESGLFGSPETCMQRVNELKAIGVGEIACLIDFGVPTQLALDHLPHLARLREMANLHVGRTAQQSGAGQTLPQLIAHHKVTHFQCTPSMARMFMVHEETAKAMAGIPNLHIGGEAFPAELAQELREAGASKVLNMYGPTETTIWSSAHEVLPQDRMIPIGRPIANNQIYLLNSWLQPIANNGIGDIYIGGEGVTRGYLNRPALTAERYIPHPFAKEPGARLYRCGDLGRHTSSGVVEFMGRADHQVKVRGYRIEPGEIETRLNQHPQVRASVVLMRRDTSGDAVLIAWLVPEKQHPEDGLIREWLMETLPPFMVPSHFVVLDNFPLTPNRKIDRNALPSPDGARAKSRVVYAPPENEMETQLVALWKTLLGKEKIGIDDNFFDSGGHSLLAVRMHRKLEEITEKPLVLTDLYQYTTIRSLSVFLSQARDGSQTLQKSISRARMRRAIRRPG